VLTVCGDAIEENVSKRLELIHNSREQFCWTERASERLCCLQYRQKFLELFPFICFKWQLELAL
jgi:hypothetical protein